MHAGKQVMSQWVWCQWGDWSRRQGRDSVFDRFYMAHIDSDSPAAARIRRGQGTFRPCWPRADILIRVRRQRCWLLRTRLLDTSAPNAVVQTRERKKADEYPWDRVYSLLSIASRKREREGGGRSGEREDRGGKSVAVSRHFVARHVWAHPSIMCHWWLSLSAN